MNFYEEEPDHDEVQQAEVAWEAWGREGALSQLAENLSEDSADQIENDIDAFVAELRLDPERFEQTMRLATPWSVANGEVHFDPPDVHQIQTDFPEIK